MTFSNGNTTMDSYVDFMATQLVATGVWSEPDAGFYPAGATPAKRVIFDGTVYVFLQRAIKNGNANAAAGTAETGTGSMRANEIRVSFGSGYNLGTHLLTGTVQDCGVPLEVWQKGTAGTFFLNNDVGAGNKAFQHFTWIDPNGSIVAIVAAAVFPNTCDMVCMFSLERNTIKQYADGFSNLYWTCIPLINPYMSTGSISTDGGYFCRLPYNFFSGLTAINGGGFGSVGGGGNMARPIYFHPFNGAPTYDEPVYIGSMNPSGANHLYHIYTFAGINANGSSNINPGGVPGRYPGIEFFFSAYRSPGDSKAYFQFPWFNNNADPRRRSLIAQSNALWFPVYDNLGGLSDGDIIDYTAPGPVLQRFLVKSFAPLEATIGSQLNIAIRFA